MTTIEVLNQIDAVPESSVVIDVAMSNSIYRGPEGKPGPIGPIGKPGPQGKSGVYVGEEEPTDGSTVWIDPEGGATIEYATEQFVEEAIASIPKPDLTEYAKISDIPDTSNFTTEEDVNTLISNALGVIENGTY